MLQIHVPTYSTIHKAFGVKKNTKLVAELGEAPRPGAPSSRPSRPLPLPPRPSRPAGGGEGISPAKVTGPRRPRRPPPSATRSPPSPLPPRRGAASGRALPPFVKRRRRPPRGTPPPHLLAVGRPAVAAAPGVAAAAGEDHRGGRGAAGPGGGGRREGAGQGRGRSGNSLSPRGGGRRGLQLGAHLSALHLPTRLEVRRGGGGRDADSSGGRRPACHGREFARGAGAPGTLREAAEEQRRRVPTYRGLNHRPESAPAGGGEAAAHRPAPRPGPPAPPRSRAGRRARSPAGPPAPARSLPGWGPGPGPRGPGSRRRPRSGAMVGSGSPRAAHSLERPPPAFLFPLLFSARAPERLCTPAPSPL